MRRMRRSKLEAETRPLSKKWLTSRGLCFMNHTVDGRNPSRTTVQKPYDLIPCKQGGAGFRPSTWGVCLGLLFNRWFSNIPDSPVLLRGKKTPWAVRINENTSKNKRLLSDLGIGAPWDAFEGKPKKS